MIGKLFHIGRLTSPSITFSAFRAAAERKDLRLHHLLTLSETLQASKYFSCIITHLPSIYQPFKLEAMSNAPINTKDEVSNFREGVIIFRRSGFVQSVIRCLSRLAGRVARSKSIAELLAAADGADRVTHLKHPYEDMAGNRTMELSLDSLPTLNFRSTSKESREVRNKIINASLRQEFNRCSIKCTQWTCNQSHPAHALATDNPVISRQLNEMLHSDKHNQPESFNIISSDILPPFSSSFKDLELSTCEGNKDAGAQCNRNQSSAAALTHPYI